MEAISTTLHQLNDLNDSIHSFIEHHIDNAIYRAPIIDSSHPEGYRQTTVTGLKKFSGHVETERSHVEGLSISAQPPNDFTTNAPHMLAVWDEFLRAEWPILSIAQLLDCGNEQVKIDVVARGGDEWIKVNTIKESRLLAEFREQDSYINSDYDSDSQSSYTAPATRRKPPLINSLIIQAQSLLRAASNYPRPIGLPPPRITYVLNRLSKVCQDERDPRIQATFDAIDKMGINLINGPLDRPPPLTGRQSTKKKLSPTTTIMLDLSVIIALCCDSTHHPLPTSDFRLEARFRPNKSGNLQPHTNVTKDLRDQLEKEMERPLISELQTILEIICDGSDLAFYVTREVRNKLPTLVEVIGGKEERARAKALFGDGEFWSGSRWEGKEGVLRDIKVRVLEDSTPTMTETTSFQQSLAKTCESMLSIWEIRNDSPSSSRPPSPAPPIQDNDISKKVTKAEKKGKRNPPVMKLPSGHTLRTLLAGSERGRTVLTNNRGAVGKIIREMGVSEGLPGVSVAGGCEMYEGQGTQRTEKAAIWVVNPSSLSEWRRLEVERENASSVSEPNDTPTRPWSDIQKQ